MRTLSNWITRFGKDEKGSIAVETVLIIPALFWAYLALFSIFDAYRQYSLNQKAAYTIGDMVSRETTPINGAYVDGARAMMAFLVQSRNGTSDVAIRISSIAYDEDSKSYTMDWSVKRGEIDSLSGASVKNWHHKLPVMSDNDRITLVETWVQYDPPFDTGLPDQVVENFIFTKPRYAPRVLFDSSS